MALQASLAKGVEWGNVQLALPAVIGVAQADGAVIDGPAGVRRALEALRYGRAQGAGSVAVDADLTGTTTAPPLNERSLVTPSA